MSEIIGKDCDGRPLRAGDWVEPTEPLPSFIPPGPWTVDGPDPNIPGNILMAELDLEGERFCSKPCGVRRIDRTDHQPANQSFEELVQGLKSGAPECAE